MHKKRMGLRREIACLSLLLLMILPLETPCLAAGSGRLNRFKGGSGFQVNPVKPHGSITGNAEKDADAIFGADKRKVYTGPNPLHNR